MQLIAPGIWKLTLGKPEAHTPIAHKLNSPKTEALQKLPQVANPPIPASAIKFKTASRGCLVEIPMVDQEQIYGFGLQLKSLNQTAKKRTLRMNSDPVADTGDSHAPVPFYVTTSGYGVYIDTARYAAVYTGSHLKVGHGTSEEILTPTSNVDIYKQRALANRTLAVDIPTAQGVDLYFFAGPTLKDVVQRYNLFSGGGCIPAVWGLGVWYRYHHQQNQENSLKIAQSLRDAHMPCDVFGLEPSWLSNAYSASYTWSAERFPNPAALIETLHSLHYNINLWEHVYVHPTSPLYTQLKPLAGDWEVWNGLVPDLSLPQARKIFADFHNTNLVQKGITGFKLDECDNSDFISSPWSFPEYTQYPSGMDGEQFHSLLGIFYQHTLNSVFRDNNIRTLCQVRASHAFAAPYPFVLYSDLYDHRDFVRGVTTMGFTGLLWSPEVRHAVSVEDLLRRIQSVILSPQALINAWYIQNPPWLQIDVQKNNNNEFLPNAKEVESQVRELFNLRMQLIPHMYAAFAKYYFDGTPPFRALVMDYPTDPNTHKIDDQWLIGDNLLAAPLFAGQTERDVYLPGDPATSWYDFHTHQKYPAGKTHKIPAAVNTVPLFVKENSILALAQPLESVRPDTVFQISALAFGKNPQPATLFEDDGITNNFEKGKFNHLTLAFTNNQVQLQRPTNNTPARYQLANWKHIP